MSKAFYFLSQCTRLRMKSCVYRKPERLIGTGVKGGGHLYKGQGVTEETALHAGCCGGDRFIIPEEKRGDAKHDTWNGEKIKGLC